MTVINLPSDVSDLWGVLIMSSVIMKTKALHFEQGAVLK